MSHSLVIEITVPLTGSSFLDHAETLVGAKQPVADLVGKLGKSAQYTVRIVRARSDAGQPRKRRIAPVAAAAE